MAIPGYDSGVTAEDTLEQAGASIAVVAAVVPDTFGLEKSAIDSPIDALAAPVDIRGMNELKAVEAIRISLVYDPSKLPPGASPTDVAVAVETETDVDGTGATDRNWEPLESTVDLAATTVTAVLNDVPPGSTVVAAYDDGYSPAF